MQNKFEDRLVNVNDVIEAVDKHTREDETLDEDISVILEEVKTAFDKEKVIEELKEIATHSASCKNQCEFGIAEYFDYMGAEVAHKTTIEIVEKGGIE